MANIERQHNPKTVTIGVGSSNSATTEEKIVKNLAKRLVKPRQVAAIVDG